MSTELVAVQTAVAEFDKVAAGLAELQKRFAGVVYDVTTPAGMEAAKEARAEVRAPRYEIERVRKEAKAPILELGRALDARAKEITAAILVIEEPIDQQIKAEEARKEAEKQAKIAAEQKRVADIQERISELHGNRLLTPTSGLELIERHIQDLERIVVDASFAEFQTQAETAKTEGLARLRGIHAAAIEHEAEQARIKAERDELARLRAEQEAAAAAERQRIEDERRKVLALAATEKAERDAITAREDAARRERIAAEEAEIAARRAEVERQEREARQAREAEAARIEAERIAAIVPTPAFVRPSDDRLCELVATTFHVPADTADLWLRNYGQAPEATA